MHAFTACSVLTLFSTLRVLDTKQPRLEGAGCILGHTTFHALREKPQEFGGNRIILCFRQSLEVIVKKRPVWSFYAFVKNDFALSTVSVILKNLSKPMKSNSSRISGVISHILIFSAVV